MNGVRAFDMQLQRDVMFRRWMLWSSRYALFITTDGSERRVRDTDEAHIMELYPNA